MTMSRCVRLFLLLCLPWLCGAALAAEASAPGIGLVLSGGGARGAAHIGVLKVLERERIPVAAIAGTSMGAIVGGLYAAGYSAEEIERIILAINWRELFNDDPPRRELPMRRKEDDLRFLLDFKLGYRDGRIQLPAGVIQGQELLMLLRRLLVSTWDQPDFDALPVPFRCVGTDIGRGQPVVFAHGDLALAIRASLSVPAAFAPIEVDGRLMVDGGIVNNLPVDVARAMGARPLLVVNVGEPLQPESKLNSPVAISQQMLTVLMQRQTEAALAQLGPGDLVLVPQLGAFGNGEFDRVAEAIPAGEQATAQALAQLRRFSLGEREYAAWQARHRRRDFDPPLVAFLDVAKDRSRTAGYVENQLAGTLGQPLDVRQLERDIGQAYGAGRYERIDWQLQQRNGHTGLEIVPVDKSWGPSFITFGLQLSDDFTGRSGYQLVAESSLTGLNLYGGEWRNRLSLGELTGLRTELYQPWGAVGQYFTLPFAEYLATNQPLQLVAGTDSEYRIERFQAGVEFGYNPRADLQLSLAGVRGRDHARLRIGDPLLLPGRREADFTALVLGLTRDTLDQAEFPARGGRVELEFSAYGRALGGDSRGEVATLSWDEALSHGRHRGLFGLRLHTTWDDPNLLQTTGFLGGFTNLSGFAERELFGEHSLLARAVYYRRLDDTSRLFTVPVYLGGSLEGGNVWPDRSDVSLGDLIGAGSLFLGVDTIFGPVFFGYGLADTGDNAWYLNFGSLLRPRL